MDNENQQPKIIHRNRRESEPSRQPTIRRMDGMQKPSLIRFVIQLIYKNLYLLGITLLRRKNRFRRSFKRFFNRVRGGTYAGLESVKLSLADIARNFFAKVRAPFARIGVVRQQVAPLIEKSRAEKKIPFKAYGQIIGSYYRLFYAIFRTLFNYAVPVIMTVVLIVVVRNQINKQEGLEVFYNGQPIGFIQHESEFDEAVGNFKDRYISEEVLVMRPQFRLREPEPGEEFTTPKELANKLVEASGDEIEQGYGLYVDREFYGAVLDSEAIISELDTILENNSTGLEGEEVDFVKKVELDPGFYPKSSIVEMADLRKTIYSTESVDEYYTVEPDDSLSLISTKTGVPQDVIVALNEGVEENLATGQELLLSVAQPFLPVKNIYTTIYQEEFPYAVEEVPTGLYTIGYRSVDIKGQPGIREVTASISTVNNVEIERQILSTRVITQPVTEKVTVGVNDPKTQGVTDPEVTAQGFMWPTKGGRINYGLWAYPGHSGVDISLPAGTPIYASKSGRVVRALNTGTGYGRYIIIDHGDGYTTYYAHCSVLYVSLGDNVNQGDLIALIGRTGNATGNHLHFEVRYNNQVHNPAIYIGTVG